MKRERNKGTVRGLIIFLLWVGGMLSLSVSITLADGCYISERAVKKIPEISAQRAILSWKDGRETLVISSALNSEAQKLGWLIPLPSVPDRIEKQSPGALKTLNFCIQPRITHDPTPGLGAVIFLVFTGNLLLATLLFKRHRFLDLLVLLLILVFLSGLLLPSFAAARGAMTSQSTSVSVEKTVKVGAYDIAVLRAKTSDDLDAWLTGNGYSPLPAAAKEIVSEYAGHQWVFAAIKLTREQVGANTPHPLSMTFASEQPVYPLRLTTLAGGSPLFEIFVIGDKKASCDLLKEEFCDTFTKITFVPGPHDDFEPGDTCSGVATKLEIGHPAITKLMWNNCILTKFSGSIEAARMVNDLHFAWLPFKAYRQHLYTMKGARETAWILFTCLMGVCFFVSMLVCHKRISQPAGLSWYFVKVFFPLAAVTGCVSAIVFVMMPKLPASEVQITHRIFQRHQPRILYSHIDFLLKDNPDVVKKTDAEIIDYLLKNLSSDRSKPTPSKDRPGILNSVTGSWLESEDTPGNFAVERQATNLVIRVYDHTGRPMIFEYPL